MIPVMAKKQSGSSYLRFLNQMKLKKKRQKSYHHVGALGCTGARLAGLVLTALLEQLVMKAASLWMSSARL